MDNRDDRVGSSHAGLAQWSLVFADRGDAAPAVAQTLAGLCLRYSLPIYAYLRRRGHAPDEAARLLHAFVDGQSAPAEPAASLRAWLPVALERFLGAPIPVETASGPALPSNADLERAFTDAAALAPNLDAATAFAGDFAREMLAHARDRLQVEAAQAGRAGLYALLVPYLVAEPTREEAALLAAAHGLPSPAMATAIKRLRQRFRELVDTELASTVADIGHLGDERTALHAALAGAPR